MVIIPIKMHHTYMVIKGALHLYYKIYLHLSDISSMHLFDICICQKTVNLCPKHQIVLRNTNWKKSW